MLKAVKYKELSHYVKENRVLLLIQQVMPVFNTPFVSVLQGKWRKYYNN